MVTEPAISHSIAPQEHGGDEAKAEIARGIVAGKTWRLLGSRTDEGVCIDLEVGDSSTGSCGAGEGKGPLRLSGIGWTDELPRKGQVDGTVGQRVRKLIVRRNGRTIGRAGIYPSQEFDNIFFVVFIPHEKKVTLVAKAGNGTVLARKTIKSETPDF